jgi:hypothetical protein
VHIAVEGSGSFPGFNIGTTFVLNQLSGISVVSNISLTMSSKYLLPLWQAFEKY